MTSPPSVARRPPRMALPAPPSGDIQLQPPPPLPRGGGGVGAQLGMMLPMMLMMGVMSFVFIGRSGGTTMTIIFGALYAAVMVMMIVMALGRSSSGRKSQLNEERRDYLRYLAGLRKQVRRNAERQRMIMLLAHPDPDTLGAVAGSERVWERRPTDGDFGHVRVGTGPQRLATALRPPQTAPLEDLDPVTSTSLRHFIRTYATVQRLPVALTLRAFARMTLLGARSVVLDHARAMITQLVTFHTAEDMRVALCAPASRAADWEWLKWLPHLRHSGENGPTGPRLLAADRLTDLEDMLSTELSGRGSFDPSGRAVVSPHIVVLVDGGHTGESRLARETGLQGVTVIDVGGRGAAPMAFEIRLVVEAQRLGIESDNGIDFLGEPDRLGADAARAVARTLAALPGPSGGPSDDSLSMSFGLPELLAVGDPRDLDAAALAKARSRRDRLRIPIGVDERGAPLEMDLKESAEGGMGPHGLVIGATGSGKSELLRTLVAGLAVTHSSETLNFVLIDFKGGATFAGLEDLPHTSASITNLEDDLGLVDRASDALLGEMIRRQEVLRKSGGYASVRDYERARAAGNPLDPLPTLLVIIDEFSELLTNKPEFIDVFVTIGRLGRSLAVHLMLASQRLEEGRLRGLDSHLSYRVGLRTFSAAESRTVLGSPVAYELPSVPGSAYLRPGTSELLRFKAAYVSGALPPRTGQVVGPAAPGRAPVPFSLESGAEPPPRPQKEDKPAAAPTPSNQHVDFKDTVLGALVHALMDGPPAHQVWLPPLDEPASMDKLLPRLGVDKQRGLCPVGWPGNGRLTVPIGIVDMPYEQRHDLLWADLSGAGGNIAVVGAPRTGKSTLLRTLITSLALTHTPQEVAVYGIDLGGGSLQTVENLPHVGGIAAARDADRCARVVAEVNAVLSDREERFPALGLDGMATARRRLDADGRREFADVFLIIDGWTTFREQYERLEEIVMSLARRGLGYGVHLVLTANRWMEIRAAVRDLIGSRFELRLGDPTDSEVDRKKAATVPEGRPGRGLTRSKHHFLTALPRIDSSGGTEDLGEAVEGLIAAVTRAWQGPPAPKVRMLPTRVPLESLPAPSGPGLLVPFGIAESDLGPVNLDFDAEPHLVILGDLEMGKSNALITIAKGLTRLPPTRARIVMVDYRRSMLGAIESEHLLGHAGSEDQLKGMIEEVQEGMRRRMPGPDVTPEQLRKRSWWEGPDLFLLVDDYDMVASSSRNPLASLVELLPQARDVGFHVVLTRRSGGASRAMFDPVLARLREMACSAFLMSGDGKEEGLLFGVRMQRRPPGRGDLVTRRGGIRLIQSAAVEAPS